MNIEKFSYDNKMPRLFAMACVFWGAVGMLLGVIAAFQLAFPVLNFSEYLPHLAFGRLRPVHTNAVIFAFVGNGIFTAIYYSLPRLLKTSMWNNTLSKIHFWGWQIIIVLAAVTLLMGYTTGKEYAELEWPIDILITLIWVVFGVNMFGTILTRRERHLYVAIWFFIASWVTVAMLHIVNSFEMPVSLFKSYSWYAGVQDALVQWWYGHNAVAFFLTTPYLGLMYYFLPKAANRPVYSYRLSIVHFWSLIFIYIWAGPHHLLYTALPDWAQSLGTAFSIMLILPSWGGMLNGLFTLRGAWDKVREDPILKFFVVAVTCYGMATFEGPLLSLKNVNAISHYSDWTVAHVHIGALGWNGFLTFGMMYWLIPRLYNTQLYSKKLASQHFWIGTLGILLYAIPMYWSAFRSYFMMKAFTPEGQLQYQFMDVVQTIVPFYIIRAIGGTIFLIGVFMMIYNLVKTAKQGCSIYISKQMFDVLGLEWTEDKLIELPLYKDDRCLLIKVVGVLYNIPNYADMICSAEFMNLITDPVSLSGFFRVGNLSEIDIISKEDISKYHFEFQNNRVESIESNEINCFGSRGYFTSRFYFKNFIAEDQIPMYLDKIKDIVGDEVALNIDWHCKAYRSTFEIPQYLAFNFTELTKVKEFKELIKKKYEVEIDISEIEDKNNFAYVTTLVVFAIITMSIIGILSFVIFIFFLIKDHFEKIKQNLGTFLAFGISKELLLKSYLSIILKMVLYSMFVSIALLSIFQFSIYLIFKFNYLNLNNIYIIFVALIFILTSMLVSNYVIKQVLRHSPGDLVYNRT